MISNGTSGTKPILRLLGNPNTINSQRVTITLLELGLQFEIHPVDFTTRAQKSPEWLALQPFGKVPVLEDDGFFIFESRAICKYLVTKYGSKLMPPRDDLKAYALFEQACSMETCHFDPPISKICYEKIFKIKNPALSVDVPLVTKLTSDLDHVLSVYETILSKQPYLAGEELTLADLFHLPYGCMLRNLGGEFDAMWYKYPAVEKWFQELKARESGKRSRAFGVEGGRVNC